MISRILDVIVQQQAYATIIVPKWPAQPWYQRIQKLAVDSPVPIPHTPQAIMTVTPVDMTVEPLRNPHWLLQAWRIYGGQN